MVSHFSVCVLCTANSNHQSQDCTNYDGLLLFTAARRGASFPVLFCWKAVNCSFTWQNSFTTQVGRSSSAMKLNRSEICNPSVIRFYEAYKLIIKVKHFTAAAGENSFPQSEREIGKDQGQCRCHPSARRNQLKLFN